MDEREMERWLEGFDYSRLSSVREPLLQKLLSLHRSQNVVTEESENPWEKRLDDEALDYAAAAGNPAMIEKTSAKSKGGEQNGKRIDGQDHERYGAR